MKKIRDFDEFEQHLKDESLQIRSINKPQIIQRLTSPSTQKAKRLSVVAVMSICLLLSVAAASAMEFTGLTFFKNDKNSVLEMETMNEEEMVPHLNADEVIKKNLRLMEELKRTLSPGKFLYFLDAELYEQTGMSNLFLLHDNPKIEHVDEIPKNFASKIHFQNQLLQEFNLTNGMISYKSPLRSPEENLQITEKLVQQAKELNRHYGVLEGGDLLPKIHSITLTYEQLKPIWQGFDIQISPINKQHIQTSEDLSSFIELESDLGSEVYYSKEKRTLFFVHNDTQGKYLITIRNTVTLAEKSQDNIIKESELQRFIDIGKSLLSKE
jgi:hypothetical protein